MDYTYIVPVVLVLVGVGGYMAYKYFNKAADPLTVAVKEAKSQVDAMHVDAVVQSAVAAVKQKVNDLKAKL